MELEVIWALSCRKSQDGRSRSLAPRIIRKSLENSRKHPQSMTQSQTQESQAGSSTTNLRSKTLRCTTLRLMGGEQFSGPDRTHETWIIKLGYVRKDFSTSIIGIAGSSKKKRQVGSPQHARFSTARTRFHERIDTLHQQATRETSQASPNTATKPRLRLRTLSLLNTT